ncbi:MAG: HPr kinase/phosphatase C-terminal domain-containing protein [Rhodospirillaceae bacterium]|nr:HPr kinase/phosphatase C-terminal domain-containing protein [Rhodospirillaceae bacterium]
MRPAPSHTRTVHATAVSVEGVGVLLRGPSGSGKSDLALRLIDGGAALISDDQTELACEGSGLVARPPAAAPPELRGRIEVRGIGILAVPSAAQARVGLIVDLAAERPIERLPEPAAEDCLGVAVPLIVLRPFEVSAASKVRLAVRALARTAEAEP